MRQLFLIQLALSCLFSTLLFSQNYPLIEYDFQTQEFTELDSLDYDPTALPLEFTPSYLPENNLGVAGLPSEPPTENLFDGSRFSKPENVSNFFEPDDFPFSTAIAILQIQNGDTLGRCSGTFISKRHLITAAHCFFDSDSISNSSDSILICPSYHLGEANDVYDCVFAQKAFLFKNFDITENDFSVVELSEDLGLKTGWLGLAHAREDSLQNIGIFHKHSYPHSTFFLPDTTIDYNGDTLYYNYGLVDEMTFSDMSISGSYAASGQSGSALFNQTEQDDYHIYGIAIWSQNMRHYRLNDYEFSLISNLIKEDVLTEDNPEFVSDIQVYPMPFSEELIIKIDESSKILSIDIHDLMGRQQLTSQHINAFMASLRSPEMAAGPYLLSIITEAGLSYTKVIIKQ